MPHDTGIVRLPAWRELSMNKCQFLRQRRRHRVPHWNSGITARVVKESASSQSQQTEPPPSQQTTPSLLRVTRFGECLRSIETQQILLERRERELGALHNNPPQIEAERNSVQQRVERLRWQSEITLNEWSLNQFASSIMVDANSQQASLPLTVPSELLVRTIAIAQQKADVRGEIKMAEARLAWSRELAVSVKSLADMGHASRADLEVSPLAVRQSEESLARIHQESRRAGAIASVLEHQTPSSCGTKNDSIAFTKTERRNRQFEDSTSGGIHSARNP